MKDYNGNEIERGCILGSDNRFRRVDYVGQKRIITAAGELSIGKAEATENSGPSWSQNEINKYKLTIVAYRKLDVTDKHENELRVHDKVKTNNGACREVLDGIKSYNDAAWKGYVILRDNTEYSGVAFYNCLGITKVTPSPELSPIDILENKINKLIADANELRKQVKELKT